MSHRLASAAVAARLAPGGRRFFRFRPWLTVATLAALAVLLSLGTWQVQRLRWKEALIAEVEGRLAGPVLDLPAGADPAGLDYRHLRVRGRYLHDRALGFGLRAVGGEPGAAVVVPFRLDDGRTILVERGWLPERLLPPKVPGGLRPEGEVGLEGVGRWRGGTARSWLAPADRPDQRRWFSWDIPAMAAAFGQPLVPLVLVLDRADAPGDALRSTPVRAEFTNNHLGYAVTWYGLAAALAAVYLGFSFTRVEGHPSP